MSDNIIDKITGLNINGYYDQANGYVSVVFYNALLKKNDIIAYLQSDMSWDVREITGERSVIESDKETVVIEHNPLGVFEHNGDFDKITRKMIAALVENQKNLPESVSKMITILNNNSYGIEVFH